MDVGDWISVDPAPILIGLDEGHVVARGEFEQRAPIDPRGDRVVDPQRSDLTRPIGLLRFSEQRQNLRLRTSRCRLQFVDQRRAPIERGGRRRNRGLIQIRLRAQLDDHRQLIIRSESAVV